MNFSSVLDDIVESKLLTLHTAFVGKVVSFDGKNATVQPLFMVKQYGKTEKKQAVIPNVPVIESARYKITSEEITYVKNIANDTPQFDKKTVATLKPLAAGDIVFCVCAERDITEAKKGNMALPALGRHSLSDTVLVGVLN